MLNTVFGEIRDGRIPRLTFLVALLALSAAGMAIMLGVFWVSGAAEAAASTGPGADSAERVAETLGRGWLLFLSGIGVTVFFGQANLWAKRIRDLGLPGWWTVLGVVVAVVLVSRLASDTAASALNLTLLLALLLVPGRPPPVASA